VNQPVQGAPEALRPKWLTDNHLRPSGLVWSGEDMLCGDIETPFLVEKLLSGGGIKVTNRELGECLHGEPLWQVKWCFWERFGDRAAILFCGVLQQRGLGVA
jgi:hypothetical protein